MAHPFSEHRQTKVEHERVSHITKRYAKGGAVHGEKALVGKVLSAHKAEHAALDAEGPKSKHRMDRPKRAKGGRVGKHGNARTIVNVLTGGHPAAGAVPPMPPAVPVGAPPMGVGPAAAMPPPRPPMAPPPAAGPGMPPPMPMRAKGGRVNQGSPVFEEGRRNGTQVSHDRGKSDLAQLGRGKPVTYKKGGRVRRADGGAMDADTSSNRNLPPPVPMPTTNGAWGGKNYDPNMSKISSTRDAQGRLYKATGGRVESPDGVAKATKLPGGGGGGEARLAKAHRAARK